MRSAINNFNNLSPHLTRRLSSDFPTPVPSSQIKDPVWKLLLNSTRLMSVDVSGQGFRVESAAQSHPLLSNSSTTFSPRDTHHPSFLLPGIIPLLMASPANLSTSSYSSKDELANLSLDTPCGDPLPRPSSSLIFSAIILCSELHLQIDANSNPSLVWSHSNVYSSRNDLLCSCFP